LTLCKIKLHSHFRSALDVRSAFSFKHRTLYTARTEKEFDSPPTAGVEAVGKAANPLQTWTGPEDSRRIRLPDFKTIGT
jgi:hypothetical protein